MTADLDMLPLAAEEMVGAYGSVAWRVIGRFRLTPEDADDAYQATWEKAFRYGGQLRDPGSAAGWVAVIARRECLLLLLQRKGRYVPAGTSEPVFDRPDPHAAVDDALLRAERAAEVRSAVARLPARWQRLLWMLMADEPASYAEVTAATGMPAGTIGPTRGRALERLRGILLAGDGAA